MGDGVGIYKRVTAAPTTVEKITLRDTWIGSWLFFGGMLLLRGWALLFVLVWMVVTGRWAAVLVIAGIVASVFSIDQKKGLFIDSDKVFDNKTLYLVSVVLAVFMLAMAIANIWPGVYWMLEGDGYIYMAISRVLRDGTPVGSTMRLSHFLSWVRFMFVAGSAWVLWSPSKLLYWVFEIEQFLPKSRETTVAQIDPASVAGPHGEPIGQPISRRVPVVEVADEDDDLPEWIGSVS